MERTHRILIGAVTGFVAFWVGWFAAPRGPIQVEVLPPSTTTTTWHPYLTVPS